MVFDKGLHGHEVEPGFIDSASKTYRFVGAHLMESPSEDLYKAIHKSACSHFKGMLTQTEIGVEQTGVFRDEAISYKLRKNTNKQLQEDCKNSHILKMYEEDVIKGKAWTKEYGPNQLKKLKDSADRVSTYESGLPKIIEAANEDILKFSRSLGYPEPLANVISTPRGVEITHRKLTAAEIKTIVDKLFSDFNEDIQRLQSPEDKLRCIASLDQHLEWTHPFFDGCGRTNKFILDKLLVEHGFNPAILEQPFMCNFCPLSTWLPYLQNGIKAWGHARAASTQQRQTTTTQPHENPKPNYKLISVRGVIYKKELTFIDKIINLFTRVPQST
jgi:Fic/DOC family